MEKDVRVIIESRICPPSGKPNEAQKQPAAEVIKTEADGTYYEKNGKQYILWEENQEGALIRSRLTITGGAAKEDAGPAGGKKDRQVQLRKSGALASEMCFVCGEKTLALYRTPYGQLPLEVYTRELTVKEAEHRIDIRIRYRLQTEGKPAADTDIRIRFCDR